jgi:hypothetical protein
MNDLRGRQQKKTSGSAGFVWFLIPVIVAIAALIAYEGHQWGVANDCAPGVPQTGQCGLEAGIGNMFGFVGGGVFLIVGVAATSILWRRRAKR